MTRASPRGDSAGWGLVPRRFFPVSALALLLASSGCATILHGTREDVSFDSTPPGATARCEDQTGRTPATLALRRGDDHTCSIEKEGYRTEQVTLDRRFSPLFLCNCALGGLVGMLVDAVTGSMWNLSPESVSTTLESSRGGRLASADGPPDAAEPPASYVAPEIPLLAPPEKKLSLAVMDLAGKGAVGRETAGMLSDVLRAVLVNAGHFRVINRTQMETILKEQQFSLSECAGSECSVEVGRLLSAQRIVTGSLSRLGKSFLVTVQITNVETGEIMRIGSEQCTCGVEDLPRVVETAGKRLLEAPPGE